MAVPADIRAIRKKARKHRTPDEIRRLRAFNSRGVGYQGGQVGYQPAAGGIDYMALLGPLLSPGEMDARARAEADALIAAQMNDLQAQAGVLGQGTSNTLDLIRSLSQGAAGMAQGIGPAIQDTYQAAAQADAGFASALSGDLRASALADSSRNAEFLQNVAGAPQAQIDQVVGASQGAGDVLQGEGGYITPSNLGREGAAWAAYGHTLPGVFSRMGQMDSARVGAAGAAALSPIASAMAGLTRELPGLRSQIRNDLSARQLSSLEFIRGMQESDRAYDLQVAAAKAAAQAAGLDERAFLADLQLETGVNPLTGQPLPTEPPKVNEKLSAGNGFLTDDFGNPIPDGSGNLIPYTPYKAPSSGNATARRDYIQTIGGTVRDLYKALLDENKPASGSDSPTLIDIAEGDLGAGAAAAFKPTYKQAFNYIYNELRAQYGAAKPRRWRYGVRDTDIRARIKKYLAGRGIRPVAPRPPGLAP